MNNEVRREAECSSQGTRKDKYGDVATEKKVTLCWFMNSDMVKSEK